MNDKISLTGISGFGYHGVLESERKSGQEFLVDVVLYCDLGEAAKSDDLSKTINYADVAALTHKRIIGEPVNLLERLAQLIAEDIINNFDINEVEVTVHKPQAPIPLPFTDVSVSIKRKR